MSEVTVYGMPYPASSEVPHTAASMDGPCCQARVTGWECTRRAGHEPERHEATGMGGRLYASWPAGQVGDA